MPITVEQLRHLHESVADTMKGAGDGIEHAAEELRDQITDGDPPSPPPDPSPFTDDALRRQVRESTDDEDLEERIRELEELLRPMDQLLEKGILGDDARADRDKLRSLIDLYKTLRNLRELERIHRRIAASF